MAENNASNTQPSTWSAVFRQAVQRTPEKVAYVMPQNEGLSDVENEVTYGTWLSRSIRAANVIRETLEVDLCQNVGIISPNCGLYIELYGASSLAGTTLASIAHLLAPPEMVKVINNTQTTVLFVHPSMVGKIQKIRSQLTTVQHYVYLTHDANDAATPSSFRNYESLVQQQQPNNDKKWDDETTPLDTFALFLTSGTTSTPKAVMRSHAATLHWAEEGEDWVMDASTLVIFNSFAWIGATMLMTLAMRKNARFIILNGYEKTKYVKTSIKYGCTYALLMPAVVQDMAGLPDEAVEQLGKTLTHFMYGGGPANPEAVQTLLRRYPSLEITQGYGMTEIGMATFLSHEDHKRGGHVLESAGRAIKGVDIKVVNEKNESVPAGEVGEVLIKTAGCMTAYFNNKEATAETIDSDGYLRTGDAGRLDDEGYLYIKSRIKDVIITGMGYNVFPREVEDVLATNPSILEVAVAGVLDAKKNEQVYAFVVRRPGATLNEEDVLAFCKDKIAEYKLPTGAHFLSSLPKNHNRKVLKRKLRVPTPSSMSLFEARPTYPVNAARFHRCMSCGNVQSPDLAGGATCCKSESTMRQ
eukprot:TRINITY_DN14820_c0_g1_i1.p1 TRINITY_DN14820_c0_g1~~TRINITY_DN14820_c0_g1_i1.p1  ORF type:complete len:584 (+),score=123.68 TRINITY_DN14820_c0_g1_i1:204-1955(+)